MSWLRPLISLLCLCGLLGGAFAGLYLPLHQRGPEARLKIEALELDISKLTTRLAELATASPNQEFPQALLWQAATKSEAELALQDAVILLAGRTGLTPMTFGASQLKRDTTQPIIAFEIEAEGGLEQTYAFLAEMERIAPQVAIGMLRIRPARGSEVQAKTVRVYSQITVWAFWGPGT